MRKLSKFVAENSISAKLIVMAAVGALCMVLVAVAMLMIGRTALVTERTGKAQAIVDSVWNIAERQRRAAEAGAISPEEAKARLFAAAGAIRFEGDSNYVFIFDSETGLCVMNDANSPMLGKNASALKDSTGIPFGTMMLDIAKQQGAGTIRYSYPKGVSKVPLDKILFVRHFEPWHLVIATAEYMTDIDDAFWSMARTAALVIGALLLVSIAVAFAVGRSVVKPLSGLRARMQALGAGDFKTAVDGAERADEIGEMARAVVVFKDSGLAKTRLESEAGAAQRSLEDTRAARAAETAAQAAQDQFVIDALGQGLGRLAVGDFVQRIETPFAAKSEKLRLDFNATVDKLKQTMLSVVSSVDAIQSGTDEISSASGDLSKRTEQQAASLEETAAALEEITATVKKSTEGAHHALEVVVLADGDAKKGAVVVRQAVEAMGAISKSSREITQIIGVIDEIAFQTNLLALNAGVEAARAGEAGRGFAVVASEVRALAQRSAEAAKEIKGLISNSTTEVSRGVELVAESGKSLERILAQVTEINQVVAGIAASASEQAHALEEVNSAINLMDQVTQQNAAMVEESTAASHSLSHETSQLTQLIAQFRVGPGTDRWSPPTAMRRSA